MRWLSRYWTLSSSRRDRISSMRRSTRLAGLLMRLTSDWSAAMEAIPIGQFKAGDQHGALHTAKLIPHDINRSGVLMHIAFAQARSGHVKDAIETVNHINAPLRRDAVLLGIAFIQARADDIPGALATTRNMGSKFARARAYREISQYENAGAHARERL